MPLPSSFFKIRHKYFCPILISWVMLLLLLWLYILIKLSFLSYKNFIFWPNLYFISPSSFIIFNGNSLKGICNLTSSGLFFIFNKIGYLFRGFISLIIPILTSFPVISKFVLKGSFVNPLFIFVFSSSSKSMSLISV